ncbi:hypothetical protein PIB30_001398 [Stylosanthes scabra]|uniref:Uncharacterized protein n=1 Tax=Stylosanthes scabra TaxID=79078 RepID=A0ABU6Z2I8_9FABA|nr:hypothetical protein [Stylosanthes scabra]
MAGSSRDPDHPPLYKQGATPSLASRAILYTHQPPFSTVTLGSAESFVPQKAHSVYLILLTRSPLRSPFGQSEGKTQHKVNWEQIGKAPIKWWKSSEMEPTSSKQSKIPKFHELGIYLIVEGTNCKRT